VIQDSSDLPTSKSAVTVSRGAAGAHVGIWYATGGEPRHLHLAFHHELCDEPWSVAPTNWITPGYKDPVDLVRSLAALVANRHADGCIAYALQPANAVIDPSSGEIQLNQSLGLTCSTLVVRLFASAGVPLVDEMSWELSRSESRVAEDTVAQQVLVAYLRRRDAAHASAVEREVGCTRIRAEEVAAASASTVTVSFNSVVDFASALLAEL
jgi:hypothetical protein